MRILKSFLFVALTMVSFTAVKAEVSPTSPETTQIKTILEKAFSKMEIEEQNVSLTFMLTDKSEILVLSTNNEELDRSIKEILNYQKIAKKDLEAGKKYTLPVSIK